MGADPASGVGVLAALAAGTVSFLSPCVLPLVPGYLSAVVGVAPSDLEHAGARRVLPPSLAFVASFSLIFILLALGAILSAAALTESVGHAAVLLAFYSAGLAIPFLATALAFNRMTSAFAVVKRYFSVIVGAGGAGLILIG